MNTLNSTVSLISDTALTNKINDITFQINRYGSIFIFLFGSIGNILNLLILSQSSFRSRPCAQLFLFSSVMNLIAIVSGLFSRILAGWGADLTATDRFFCKLRGFVVNTVRPVAIWYILFAIIDRWFLSSLVLQRRQMSSMKSARRAMIISLIFSTLYFSHAIYCHEPYQTDAPQKCYGATAACRYATDIPFTCLSILPLIPMFVFGLLTIRNVQQSRNRTVPGDMTRDHMASTAVSTQPNRSKRVDRSLLSMLLMQIFILCALSIPFAVQKVYASITADVPFNKLQIAISNMVYSIAQLFHFLSNGVPFYIYTLAGGNAFRKVLVRSIVNIKEKILKLRR